MEIKRNKTQRGRRQYFFIKGDSGVFTGNSKSMMNQVSFEKSIVRSLLAWRSCGSGALCLGRVPGEGPSASHALLLSKNLDTGKGEVYDFSSPDREKGIGSVPERPARPKVGHFHLKSLSASQASSLVRIRRQGSGFTSQTRLISGPPERRFQSNRKVKSYSKHCFNPEITPLVHSENHFGSVLNQGPFFSSLSSCIGQGFPSINNLCQDEASERP